MPTHTNTLDLPKCILDHAQSFGRGQIQGSCKLLSEGFKIFRNDFALNWQWRPMLHYLVFRHSSTRCAKQRDNNQVIHQTSVCPASSRTRQVTASQATESRSEGFRDVWMNACRSHHPSVAGAELPLASHHSSLVAVGSLHFPWQVLDLCLQLGLLVLKLYKIEEMENQSTTEENDIKCK